METTHLQQMNKATKTDGPALDRLERTSKPLQKNRSALWGDESNKKERKKERKQPCSINRRRYKQWEKKTANNKFHEFSRLKFHVKFHLEYCVDPGLYGKDGGLDHRPVTANT